MKGYGDQRVDQKMFDPCSQEGLLAAKDLGPGRKET